ncbi:MAG: NTP transferase domain-containing protein [Steroidobacteraceae bacterium]
MTAPPLQGLVLAGGLSSRMKRDKAGLEYEGRDQLSRAVELLGRHVQTVSISVRSSQSQDPLRGRWPMIVDSVEGEGPLVGICSALAANPAAAWLVIACDLPFLSDATLAALIARRDPQAVATVYRSSHDGLPEPLCAIWEPSAAPLLAQYHAEGGRCPRKFLIRRNAPLLELPDPRALDNVNTPQEYDSARHALP